MTHILVTLLIFLVIFLGIRVEILTAAPYTRYKKRRDFFLKKIRTGSVLRGTCSGTGEVFTISRSGIKKEIKPSL